MDTIRQNKFRPINFSETEKLEIISKYQSGLSSIKIANIYKVEKKTILRVLRNKNIERRKRTCTSRKYNVNENFFETIDTEEKAYFLGYIYGDGCNNINKNTLSILCLETDKELFETFRKLLQTNRPFHIPKKYKEHHNNYCLLEVTSKKISQDLLKWNVFPNKTKIIKYPDFLREDLNPHFIRGVFDSDGTFSYGPDITKRYCYGSLSFAGALDLLSKVKEIFGKILNKQKQTALISNKERYTNYRILKINSKEDLLKIYNYLYNKASIFLPRKKKKIEEYLKLKKMI